MTEENLNTSTNVQELSVFIVDDDKYYNALLTASVRKIGNDNNIPIKLKQFHDAEECMEHIKEEPDLILLDFYLDVNNDITSTGYDVLTQIKSAYPDIKILVISAQHDWEQFKDDFLRFGAEDFLKKDRELPGNIEAYILENSLTN